MPAKLQQRRPTPMATLVVELDRSSRTVRRWMAEPRAEYEARSVSRAEPGLAEGISRATWYRREKKRSEKFYAECHELAAWLDATAPDHQHQCERSETSKPKPDGRQLHLIEVTELADDRRQRRTQPK